MSEIQRSYNDSAFRKDLKKLKLLSKKQNLNSIERAYETRTVFQLKPYIQMSKKYNDVLKEIQQKRFNENFTFVKVNKAEIEDKSGEDPYLFQNKNMLAMTDIKMPLYQDIHLHINLGMVQNKQSPSFFIYPYLKYYFDEKTLLKVGYYKSRSSHVSLSLLRNIYADIYLSGEYKFGNYIQGVPLSQTTLRFIKMNANNQVYLNYGDLNSIGYQHQIWKKGNYKAIFNLEYNDLQIDHPNGIVQSFYLRTQLTKKIANSNVSVNLQTNNSLVLSQQEINTMYKINNQWKVKIGLQLQSNNINVIAGFKKSNFEVSLPFISFEFSSKKLLIALGIASLFAIVGYKVLSKNKKSIETSQEDKFKEELLAKSKKRIGQISLIEFKAQENNQYQVNRNGLIIIDGYYGNKSHIDEIKSQQNRVNFLHKNKERIEIIDVTIPLRFFQSKNGLFIQTISKENLIGFFNPCREAKSAKSLLIRYSINGVVQEQEFMDEQEVALELSQ